MGKFLGVNITDEEQVMIQNKIIPKLMKGSGKIVPDGADILHELIRGYDPEKAEKALKEKQDIQETEMYSIIKKALNRKISDDVRELVSELRTKYQWSNKMISCIFSYCAAKDKGYLNYVTKVAYGWADEGIKTYDDMIRKIAAKKKETKN